MKGRIISFILVAVSLLTSCINSAPSWVISKGDMEDILLDYHKAQALAEMGEGDNNAKLYQYVQAVFQKHGITEAEFDSSMVWYSRNAEDLEQMYKNIHERLQHDANLMGANISSDEPSYFNYASEGDTANVWVGPTSFTLLGNEMDNILSLTHKADKDSQPGDYFKLIFDNQYIQCGFSSMDAFALMQVTYTNDSIYSIAQHINLGMTTEMNVSRDDNRKDWKPKSIRFTFYIPNSHTGDFSMFRITRMALIRFHDVTSREVSEEPSDSTDVDSPTPTPDDIPEQLEVVGETSEPSATPNDSSKLIAPKPDSTAKTTPTEGRPVSRAKVALPAKELGSEEGKKTQKATLK